MAKKHVHKHPVPMKLLHVGAPLKPTPPLALVRVPGAPTVASDYRLKVKNHRPECHTVDSVDSMCLYGREGGFWGFASFKIDRLDVEWHESVP
jgi:hypothetical protein